MLYYFTRFTLDKLVHLNSNRKRVAVLLFFTDVARHLVPMGICHAPGYIHGMRDAVVFMADHATNWTMDSLNTLRAFAEGELMDYTLTPEVRV